MIASTTCCVARARRLVERRPDMRRRRAASLRRRVRRDRWAAGSMPAVDRDRVTAGCPCPTVTTGPSRSSVVQRIRTSTPGGTICWTTSDAASGPRRRLHHGHRLADRLVARQVERDARLRRPPDAAPCRLERDRMADRRRRRRRSRPASRRSAATECGAAHAVGGEDPERRRRGRASSSPRASAASITASTASAVGDRSAARRSRRPRSRSHRLYAYIRPSTAAAGSGNENDGTRRPGRRSGRRAAEHHRDDRLGRAGRGALDLVDRRGRATGAAARGSRARRRRRDRRSQPAARRRSPAGVDRQSSGSGGVDRRRARRPRRAAVASTPGLRELVRTATRGPRRHRLGGEHARRVEHRPHGRHLDQPACWYSASLAEPIAAAPVRTATIGRVRPTRRAMRANLRGLPKRSVYIAITRVVLVVLPELEEVVAGHVALVAERHEPRDAHRQLGGELQQRRAERCPTASRSRRRRRADRPGRARRGSRRSRRARRRPCSPVRSAASRCGARGRRAHAMSTSAALGRGDDDRAAHPLGDALVDRRVERSRPGRRSTASRTSPSMSVTDA